MKWIKQFIIVTSFAQVSLAQNLQQTFEFGQSQFDQNHWKIAEKTFQRVLFFDHQNIYRSECLRGLATISKLNGDEIAALNYLDQLYFISEDDEVQSNIQFDRIQIFIEQHEFKKALAELYQIDPDIAPSRLALYEGYCQYMLHDFAAVEAAFEPLCQTPMTKEAIKRYLLEAQKIENFNPKTYQILSYFVPGLGQILLGDLKNSVNSLVLNGSLVVLFIDTARRLSLFDATLSVLPWFYRYYTGGIKVTQDLALQKKENLHKQNLAKMIDVLTGVTEPRQK